MFFFYKLYLFKGEASSSSAATVGSARAAVQRRQSYGKHKSPSRTRTLPVNNAFASMHHTHLVNSGPIIDDDINCDDENHDYIIRVGEIFNYR